MTPDALIVSPYAGGHHGEYLRWMAAGLTARGASLAVAAPPALLAAEAEALAGVDVRPLPHLDRLEAAGSLVATGRALGAAVRAAIEAVRAPRVLLPTLDHAQFGLALGLRFERDVRIAGLLLRATLHEPAAGPGARLRRARKTALLRLAARNPHLGAVLALDPDAVGPLRALGLDARWLPDPVEPPSPTTAPAAVRAALGVPPGRRMLLLFGSLEARKGVFDVLEAVGALPAAVAERLALVVVGRTYAPLRARLGAAVAAAQRSAATVVFDERFVPDAELDDLVAAADVVLAPYRGHVGSSGVVLRAAAAGTPLLATTEGMVGRTVRAHRLGRTADPTPDALAAAIAGVAEAPAAGFDAAAAAAYTAAHSVDRFVDTIHAALFS